MVRFFSERIGVRRRVILGGAFSIFAVLGLIFLLVPALAATGSYLAPPAGTTAATVPSSNPPVSVSGSGITPQEVGIGGNGFDCATSPQLLNGFGTSAIAGSPGAKFQINNPQ